MSPHMERNKLLLGYGKVVGNFAPRFILSHMELFNEHENSRICTHSSKFLPKILRWVAETGYSCNNFPLMAHCTAITAVSNDKSL